MRLAEFKESCEGAAPPENATPLLRALWHDAKGDWHAAHRLTQAEEGSTAAWVHAYLHRKEGDLSNASYWYRRAGRPVCSLTLEQEWDEIVGALLSGAH